MSAPIARAVNTLADFCALRDPLEPADVAILFGGSILAGGDVFAGLMRSGIATHYMIVGGNGHTTEALRDTLGWPEPTEADLFDRYLRERHGLAADLLERESTNCGNNVTKALWTLRGAGVPAERLILVQDATMQRRMDAGFRLHAPSARIMNHAAYRTLVDDSLAYVDPPAGMWNLDRYVAMLLGEVPRWTGYGPTGRGFIATIDVPDEVRQAYEYLISSGFSQRS
ncbi:ElyC/SanA/YdcF family protein [Actinoplanes sp. CA-030573]|uniref:ElyC/SanA/YdcF family protein n=1 Tax=Actinoplanes sp. CA-030573 TaxID=3239898 RepID=UPI003D8F9399